VTAIMDAEIVCTDDKGVLTFERLHSRCNDHQAFASNRTHQAEAWLTARHAEYRTIDHRVLATVVTQ
jgi:hypothetical protein